MNPNLTDTLTRGCRQLGLELSAGQQVTFDLYLKLLRKWNSIYNLTSLDQDKQILDRHFLDSLSIHQYLQGECSLDVGSGAGFPGVPLAIVKPEHRFILLDSNGKRCRFLTQARIELKLGNVVVVQSRVQDFRQDMIDQIIIRAYGDLATIAADTRHLLEERTVILAMRGAVDKRELRALKAELWECHCLKLTVPYLEEQRHLVSLKQKK